MYRFRDTLPINISEQTISGDLVTIENPEEMGVIDSLEVSLSPIQDLNGYSKPWVGGAGKNKLPPYATTQTKNGITFTVNSDGTIKANGTATATTVLYLSTNGDLWSSGSYILNGCPSGGGNNKYCLRMYATGGITLASDFGSGVTFTGQSPLECAIVIWNGQTVSNLVFKPMIRLASETDATYEPYENICPISGRTEVVTQRTGKNLLPYPYTNNSGTANGITYSTTADGRVTISGTATATAWVRLYGGFATETSLKKPVPSWITADTDYVLSGGQSSNFYVQANLYSGTSSVGQWIDTGSGKSFSLTSEQISNADSFAVFIRVNSGQTVNATISPMIEEGSAKTSWTPYNGTTYTTALGRTVYGGTLDVVSGVLTVDRAMVDLSTAWNWRYASGSGGYFYTDVANFSGLKTYSAPITNRLKTVTSGSEFTANTFCIYCASNINFKLDSNYTTADSFKTWLTNNPIEVCYKLATPQTYQLTPQQIDLLLGTNHLWSDGEINVVWHKDLTKGRILPTEAVSINGQYIENVLDGYRTLYTKGRESLGAELNTYSVGTADGEKFKNKRYPARTITVGFQLIGENPQDFRQRFNNLNNLLAIEEADFIFNDETDKFFSGYPIMDAEVEAGQDSVKGEWKIYCAYPFKRSVDPITLTMADATVTNTTATFTIDYKGSRPARPVLRAKFAGALSGGSSSEDGDCGFVAFMDGEENIIQLGNPEVLDLDEYTKAETLINKSFVNISDFTRTGGHTYKGTVTGSVSTSNTTDAYWNGGRGQTQSYAKPTYGSGTGLHGAILWKNTAGAVNFTMHMVHRLCVSSANQTGVFECGAYNHDTGVMVAGFVIDKSANGTTGTVRYIVNGTQVGSDNIDLSYYNNHFGYCNRTPVYVQQTYYDPVKQTYKVQVKTKKKKKKKKKYVTKSRIVWVARTRTVFSRWNYTQSNLNSSIEKEGSYVYIKVGNLPLRTFNVPDVEQMIAHDASVFMGTYGTAMHTNMIHSLLFRREAGVPFAEQPNVFTAGDIVEADCNEATVYIYRDGSIGGHLEPQYGALGNDWEDFMLTSGSNVIRATWSEWVNPTYKPQIEIEYNEVFI